MNHHTKSINHMLATSHKHSWSILFIVQTVFRVDTTTRIGFVIDTFVSVFD
jgi:hypothetical protein